MPLKLLSLVGIKKRLRRMGSNADVRKEEDAVGSTSQGSHRCSGREQRRMKRTQHVARRQRQKRQEVLKKFISGRVHDKTTQKLWGDDSPNKWNALEGFKTEKKPSRSTCHFSPDSTDGILQDDAYDSSSSSLSATSALSLSSALSVCSDVSDLTTDSSFDETFSLDTPTSLESSTETVLAGNTTNPSLNSVDSVIGSKLTKTITITESEPKLTESQENVVSSLRSDQLLSLKRRRDRLLSNQHSNPVLAPPGLKNFDKGGGRRRTRRCGGRRGRASVQRRSRPATRFCEEDLPPLVPYPSESQMECLSG